MQIFLQFYNFNFSSKSKFSNRIFTNRIAFNKLYDAIFNVNFCKISTQKKCPNQTKLIWTLFFNKNTGITTPLLRPCRHLRHERHRAGEPC